MRPLCEKLVADTFRISSWLLATLTCATLSWSVHAEAPPAKTAQMDAASVVSMAGRQRMLSQRMVKTYLMLGQGIATNDARTLLQNSIKQFDSQLATLKTYQPTPEVQRALVTLEDDWATCKPLLTAAPSKTGAVALYDANEALQYAAHSVTLAYDNSSGAKVVHLTSLAGRQRMLSQRMAKFYFYRTWGLYDIPAAMELNLSRAHFTAMLIQIEKSPYATAQTKAAVAQVRREWEPYQQILYANHDPAKMRQDAPRVAELSERVLASTEELVAQLVSQAQAAPN